MKRIKFDQFTPDGSCLRLELIFREHSQVTVSLTLNGVPETTLSTTDFVILFEQALDYFKPMTFGDE